MQLESFFTRGLGDSSYLLASGDEAVVIDPQRDAGRFLSVAESNGWRVRAVLETHVHNDYVSGAHEIREATGADLVMPADAGYTFAHTPASDGHEVRVGGVVLTAMATPGHTPEHLAWVARGDGAGAPDAVFTGGSLMVGSSGRTDLLGPDRTDELTRAQYRSLQRIASLPPSAAVLPTHGAGSFCGASATPSKRSSTVEQERGSNPALAATDVEAFVAERLAGLMEYPAYYRHMAPINRAGATLLRDLAGPASLDAEGLVRATANGAWVVDARRREAFAEGHVPGSINVELDESFGTYVGWIVPWGAAVVLVLPDADRRTLREAWTQLIRIGWDRVEGYLDGGIDAWRSSGRDTSSYPTATLDDLCAHVRSDGSVDVLDVRQPTEWADGVIPGSRAIFVGDLRDRVGELPLDREQWAVCRTGHRSAIAASLLNRAGVPVRVITKGGVPDWLETCAAEG